MNMAELYFKRVLHPVGQGAFFTEQFFDGDNTIFNVVYDCGELHSIKHLEREINNTLIATDQPEVIDVMFISHLDEDHISGIDYLVKCGCLTKRSVVILPLNYPLVLKLILKHYRDHNLGRFANGVYDGLMSLFESGAKILGIDNNNEAISNDPQRLDEGLNGVKDFGAVRSLQPLTYREWWHYIPFNTILDDDRYKKFIEALNDANIDKSLLSDIGYVTKHLDELIKIYQGLPKAIGKVTAINVNSLNVLSYGATDIDYKGADLYYFGRNIEWFRPWNKEAVQMSRCSCLYTGDCVMERHFNHCLDLLIKHVTQCIGMIQIPHHGREGNYDKTVVQRSEVLSGFTNFNSTHKANRYVKKILNDFLMNGKSFFQITEHFHSRMELYVRLG